MINTIELKRGLFNRQLIIRIGSNLRNPGRHQIAAAFMAGIVVTAALACFGIDAGNLFAGENDKNITPDQQNVPGNYREIAPDKYFNYELVYALKEGALISG